ncbi:MAG: hypothetical protein K0R02_509, partial [Rickettsiaceae bacterium]|nr:hypothetical protein [Rickettsiaceae bacterium]
ISIFLSLSQNITILDFFGSKIGYKGIEYLAAGLAQNNSLRELGLAGNYIGDKGLECLVDALKGKPHFRKLCLLENGLTNESVKYIADLLKKIPGLSELNLKYSWINEEGLKYLVPFIKKSNLTSLELADGGSGCGSLKDEIKIAESLIEILSENKTLTHFLVGYYFEDSELNLKMANALSLNSYVYKMFENYIFSLGFSSNEADTKYHKDIINYICLENKKNVESIQAVIQKAIAYCTDHKPNLTTEDLNILTIKDKDFVKAQLNAHPEWLEIHDKEPLAVEEFYSALEECSRATNLDLIGV